MANSNLLLPAGLLSVAIVVGAALVSRAGPLDPPGGPVASTYKTLTEVEPRIAANSTNTPGDSTCTLKITAAGSYYLTGNVTAPPGKIGILIAGSHVTLDLNGYRVFGSIGSTQGITCTGAPSQVTVRNGTVSGWIGNGIDLSTAGSSRCESITALSNSGNGIVTGALSIVRECIAGGNGLAGISIGVSSIVESCVCNGNAGTGIQATGAAVRDCEVRNNLTGIAAGVSGFVEHCRVEENTNNGITASGDCTISENTCIANGIGGSGVANISVTATFNRIEGNMAIDSNRGIKVADGRNIIVRNMAANNATNYDIAQNNSVQAVVTGKCATFSGSAGGTPLGSTDPWINFSY